MLNASRLSRIALALAGGLALTAIGARLWRERAPAAPNAPAAQPQPNVDHMIATLETRLKTNPNDAGGWRMLGWSFFQTGRYGESAMAYRRATQLAPGNADLWSSLGEALVLAGGAGVPADAKAAFETALRHDPADPRSRYFLAVAKDVGGDHRGAITDWVALLRASPADAPWYADVREAIVRVGQKNAIDVSSQLAGLAAPAAPSAAGSAIPGPTPEQMRAASALPPGQQEAMVDAMVAGLAAKLQANPGNVDGWVMLMRSYQQLGRDRDARNALARAKAANPSKAARLDSAAKELGIT